MLELSETMVQQTLEMRETIDIVESAYRDNVAGKIYAGDRIYMPIRRENRRDND